MKLVYKWTPRFTTKQLSLLEDLAFHTTKLYNIANHRCREEGFLPYVKLEKELKSNWHRDYLHSHTYQQCLKMVEQNWKSFFASSKDFKKNPHKYKGTPQPPKYKHVNHLKNEIIFTQFAIRVQENVLKLSLSKKMQERHQVDSFHVVLNPDNMPFDVTTLQQIRFQWRQSLRTWEMVMIYQQKERVLLKTFTNTMSIDLGVDNLAALTFLEGEDSYLINGKPLKSKNSYYNKEIARLTSIVMKQAGTSEDFVRTRRIRSLQGKRNRYVHNFLHQASRQIVDLAVEHQCRTIVIGKMKGIKQEHSWKMFVQIPHARFVDLITYKAKLAGIKVTRQNEAFTSGCSALDEENISQKAYAPGRRIHRGLFVSNMGLAINADVNGSLNILRKYLNQKGSPDLIRSARDNGCLKHPKRILVG
ncbi:RNA-guided endonuclease InsQ/TnpB family protein [Paenibacillus caui]|uniref:RNA-guided endonuclease InsQ/TnpB family protein n=1 Tax=Paenibacillus caui TaxID=2873927 RepID=UPI001CA98F40|nr:RNA-guided endonuclease TnpB family protein [Paenibacillus caui]